MGNFDKLKFNTDFLSKNEVPYNKKIDDMFNLHFENDEYQNLALDILDKIDLINRKIMAGYDFSGSNYDKTIKTLSKFIVKTSQINNDKQFRKITKKYEVLSDSLSYKLVKPKKTLKIKETTVDFLKNTITGLSNLNLIENTTPSLKEASNILKEGLEKVLLRFDYIYDNKSKEAYEISIELIKNLKAVRNAIGKTTITKFEVEDALKRINKTIDNWQTLYDIKSRPIKEYLLEGYFNGTKMNLSEGNFMDYNDEFNIYCNNEKYRQKFLVFKEHIEEYKKSLKSRSESSLKFSEKEKDTEKKIVDLKKEILEIKSKYENGRMDKILAASKIKELQNKIVVLENSKSTSHKESTLRSANIDKNLNFINELEYKCDEILLSNPRLLYSYYYNFDLDSIASFFSGVASEEEVEKTKKSLLEMEVKTHEYLHNIDEVINDTQKDFYETLNEYENERSNETKLDSNEMSEDEALSILDSVGVNENIETELNDETVDSDNDENNNEDLEFLN